ncbi:hypothetical protein [Nonomuraea sp. C10]|uniref:hypothetical protein n=1 Tax=Nonomuraea sp. C10 TaxID=2600577 RepID=UPI00165048D0|nr:hypothetical protein [Nonomuraea sp. C10]
MSEKFALIRAEKANFDIAGDLGHRTTGQHRQHSPIPLLHHGHIHQGQSRPPDARRRNDARQTGRLWTVRNFSRWAASLIQAGGHEISR